MANGFNITDAEWQIMRLLWTEKQLTSSQLIRQLNTQGHQWQDTTVKTLLSRLVKKNIITVQKNKRPYLYSPLIGEQEAIDASVKMIFANICSQRQGKALQAILQYVTLSQHDISQLIAMLEQKRQNAPLVVPCNCCNQCNFKGVENNE